MENLKEDIALKIDFSICQFKFIMLYEIETVHSYIVLLYNIVCICSPPIFNRYFQFYISIYHYLSCA